jgi:hypothetical protein
MTFQKTCPVCKTIHDDSNDPVTGIEKIVFEEKAITVYWYCRVCEERVSLMYVEPAKYKEVSSMLKTMERHQSFMKGIRKAQGK